MENILQNGQNFVFQLKIILVIFKDIVIILYNIVLGKIEGDKNNNTKENWHGHISVIKLLLKFIKAITVAPEYRR